ncbi:MAG: glycosyltransferase family 9 protein, partial [Gammaproteobacteria bacterium]
MIGAEGANLAREGSSDSGLYADRGAMVPDVQRIAVLRANAVGDFVVSLPALAALRRSYPDSHITLLGREWHARFLRGRPSPVDEVAVIPPGVDLGAALDAPGQDRDAAGAFFGAMRARRFDLALQLHGGGAYSNPFVRRLGARLCAGLQADGAEPLDRNLPYREPHSEVLRLLETVALVGARGCDVEPRLAITEADRHELDHVLAPGEQRPVLVLQPFCFDPRRAWPAERFAAVGDHYAAHGALVVMNGTAQEADALAQVRAAMREPALDLTGALSLGGLLALLGRAQLLVSNDTGTAHLARAIGLPSVTISWIGNLAAYGPTS